MWASTKAISPSPVKAITYLLPPDVRTGRNNRFIDVPSGRPPGEAPAESRGRQPRVPALSLYLYRSRRGMKWAEANAGRGPPESPALGNVVVQASRLLRFFSRRD